MDNTQVVAYIREQLGKGHGEAALRQHLLKHGWSQTAVDDAFTAYRRSVGAKKAARTRKANTKQVSYRDRSLRSSRTKRLKLSLAFVAVAFVAVGVILLLNHKKPTPVAAAAPANPGYAALRQGDINTLAGAIGQYTTDHNGVVPNGISIASDGKTLVLCGDTCDPTTSDVAPLAAYPSDGVHFTQYAPELAVPDDQTVYVVPAAKCDGSKGIGGSSSNPRAVVILYGLKTTAGLQQHCVTL